MYYIAICDDDVAFIDYLKKLIVENTNIEKNEVHFYQYKSGEALVDALDKHIPFDLLILDMQLGGMDGDRTAKAFRESYPNTLLVFVSGVCMPTVKSFKAEAYRYLLKQYSGEKMSEELKTIINEMKRRAKRKSSPITLRHETVFVNHEDILYVSKRKHGCDVTVYDKLTKKTENIQCNKSLEQLFKDMDDKTFAFAHSSYFINLSAMAKVNGTEVKLIDGTVLNISKSKLKEFKTAMTRYFSNMF